MRRLWLLFRCYWLDQHRNAYYSVTRPAWTPLYPIRCDTCKYLYYADPARPAEER